MAVGINYAVQPSDILTNIHKDYKVQNICSNSHPDTRISRLSVSSRMDSSSKVLLNRNTQANPKIHFHIIHKTIIA